MKIYSNTRDLLTRDVKAFYKILQKNRRTRERGGGKKTEREREINFYGLVGTAKNEEKEGGGQIKIV